MSALFLFGDRCENFGDLCQPFVAAAGTRPTIAVAHIGQQGWQAYLEEKIEPHLLAAGAAAVVPVGPDDGGNLDQDRVKERLSAADALLISGGHTLTYHRLYVQAPLAGMIRQRVAAGMPYAGISAGAILAGAACTLSGNVATEGDNRFTVRVDGRGTQSVQHGKGLNLLPGTIVEPHCGEWGGLPRLLYGIQACGVPYGLGIDEAVCSAFSGQESPQLSVAGRGLAYLAAASGMGKMEIMSLAPGSTLPWPLDAAS